MHIYVLTLQVDSQKQDKHTHAKNTACISPSVYILIHGMRTHLVHVGG